jgi:hypothetical protein
MLVKYIWTIRKKKHKIIIVLCLFGLIPLYIEIRDIRA